MTTVNLYKAQYRAMDLHNAIVRATCHDKYSTVNDLRAATVEVAFRELAEALGYEVAKIVTPADEAA